MSERTTELVRNAFRGDLSLPEGGTVLVAVPDLTRPLDYEVVLSPLLAALYARGCDVRVKVALGLHRAMSAEEIAPLESVVARWGFEVVQHSAQEGLVRCSAELPIDLPRDVVEADAIVCVGTVELHQYAGFSGGVKTLAIGCAGRETIGWMHGLELLRSAGIGVARMSGNPFQENLWKIVAPLRAELYGVFVVPDGAERAWSVTIGTVRDAFEAAVEVARTHHFEGLDAPVPWMHLRVPSSKASSFYQASRAATYAALVDRPAIAKGGWLLVDAPCPEGLGMGAGEQACAQALLRGRDALLRELRGEVEAESTGGQQRAYVIAKALDHCEIALIGNMAIPELDPMGIPRFESVEAALRTLGLDRDAGHIAENPFHRVPQLKTSA